MTIVGFNYKSISAEKKAPVKGGKVEASHNIIMKEVKEAKLSFGATKQTGLELTFEFSVKYKPEIGVIILKGIVVFMDKEEIIKKTLEQWKKDKTLPKEIIPGIYNHILSKCNVQALIMSRDMQLPSPIPLPKVK